MKKSKDEQLRELFEGNPPPANAGIFGATLKEDDCQLMIIPVPWDGTSSYGKGSSNAPEAIRKASHQLDLEDRFFGRQYFKGIGMLKIPRSIQELNEKSWNTEGKKEGGLAVNDFVYNQSMRLLEEGKIVGVLGGEHSVPFGLIKALVEKFGEFGILHIDAHHDLRAMYEELEFSHASIMHNVTRHFPQISLCQVGVRDFSFREGEYAKSLGQRLKTFYWQDMFEKIDRGRSFRSIIAEISSFLPKRIYISFDIDGLDPSLCPNTGTPVPGGLSFSQAVMLIEQLWKKHKIIGFDLCEVAPGKNSEWDVNVGARILYKLCGATLK